FGAATKGPSRRRSRWPPDLKPAATFRRFPDPCPRARNRGRAVLREAVPWQAAGRQVLQVRLSLVLSPSRPADPPPAQATSPPNPDRRNPRPRPTTPPATRRRSTA